MILIAPALVMYALAGIEWCPSFEDALDRAKTDGQVVFVAVNMDGERANETLAAKTYKSKSIVALSQTTVNLIASANTHRGGTKTCPRFGAIPCAAHQSIDKKVRGGVVKTTAEGWTIAPQHVFLKPTGEVILSVPYTVSESELTWCFHTAQRAIDPNYGSTGGRAPRRLVLDGVFDPGTEGDSGVMTRDRALELLEEAKRTSVTDRHSVFYKLIIADEPEVISFAKTEFSSPWMTHGGNQVQRDAVRAIGQVSPRSYWSVIQPLARDGDPKVRNEVAVAQEQLAAPKALKDVLSAFKKEKDPLVKKNWIRAVAAVGAADKGARKTVLRIATKETRKDQLLRLNAIIALGSLAAGDDVTEVLMTLLENDDVTIRRAAACAMGVSRERHFEEVLHAALDAEPDGSAKVTLELTRSVLRGEGSLADLGRQIREIAQDSIPRQRVFGW